VIPRLPELALDDYERYAFVRHLDRMRVAELMLVPTSAQASICRPLGYADQTCRGAANRRLRRRQDRHNAPPLAGSLDGWHDRAIGSRAETVPRRVVRWATRNAMRGGLSARGARQLRPSDEGYVRTSFLPHVERKA
jgi:hypothetical protein